MNDLRFERLRDLIILLHTNSIERDDVAPITTLLDDLNALRTKYAGAIEHDICYDVIESLMCAINASDHTALKELVKNVSK